MILNNPSRNLLGCRIVLSTVLKELDKKVIDLNNYKKCLKYFKEVASKEEQSVEKEKLEKLKEKVKRKANEQKMNTYITIVTLWGVLLISISAFMILAQKNSNLLETIRTSRIYTCILLTSSIAYVFRSS